MTPLRQSRKCVCRSWTGSSSLRMAINMAKFPHLSHWGAFSAEVAGGNLVAVHPDPADPAPSPILDNYLNTPRHPTRIAAPMIRRGWLEDGPGSDARRGSDSFVPVSWERAMALLAAELSRQYRKNGASSIFGGSYGWASAGRFHHSQSQLHRFLNCLGGYVRSVNTYSLAASEVLLPHVLGVDAFDYSLREATPWSEISEHSELIVAFGGLPLKNAQIAGGGVSSHQVSGYIESMARRNVAFVLISPLRDDLPLDIPVSWMPARPGTDVAVMMALAYVLIREEWHDRRFLDKYCVGYPVLENYLLGIPDGQPKTPEWAERISGIDAHEIEVLARRMAERQTLITTTWSIQRAQFGEQPVWMSIALAAMLGKIGLPGTGFGHGYGSSAVTGARYSGSMPSLPQGRNPIDDFIPVARIADMLLTPGATYEYNGNRRKYPHARLLYWCGGNPFHHHQDLIRLRRAFQCAETIVVHEPFWTSTARHADIVLPCTMTLERNDIGGGSNGNVLFAMHRALEVRNGARNDYDIFSELAARLAVGEQFTEGRTESAWLRHLYETWRAKSCGVLKKLPSFEEFWQTGRVALEVVSPTKQIFLEAFRRDPAAARLKTPSGLIELFSGTIAAFGYEECPGHPVWRKPDDVPDGSGGPFPLQLVANNPASRLHSQLDPGVTSHKSKVAEREPVRMNPADAAQRGIRAGDIVRVFNSRGMCLAGAVLTDALMPGVVQLSTGAWFDPQNIEGFGEGCVHGNPNVLTRDRGTSRLAQGCTGQYTLVEVEVFRGTPPEVKAHQPPLIGQIES